MQPQGDSIWGNINLCIEIALNIYYLCGEKGEGIVIRQRRIFPLKQLRRERSRMGIFTIPKGRQWKCSGMKCCRSGWL